MSSTAADPLPPATTRLPRRVFIAVFVVAIVTTAGELVYTQFALPPSRRLPLATLVNPMFLASMLESLVSSALLGALIAWSVVRNRMERRGAATHAATVLFTFTLIYLLLMLVQIYAQVTLSRPVSTWFDRWAREAFALAPFQAVIALQLGVMTLIYTLLDVVSVLIAIALALAIGSGRGAPQPPAPAVPAVHVVPALCALFVLALEWKLQFVSERLFYQYRAQHPWSLIGMVIGPLIVFGLAYWGARRGAGRPVQVRPFRALGASAVTLVVQISACLAAGICWVPAVASFGDGYHPSVDGILVLIAFLTVLWLVLSVVLMDWFAAIFYDRFQRSAAAA